MWGGADYKRGAPNSGAFGFEDLVYDTHERPAVALYGRGGRATTGQLAPVSGGGLVVYKTVLSGLPGVIVPSMTPAPLLPR